MLCRIIVIANIRGVELAEGLITTGEKRPENSEQNEHEDNARGDGNGDQDDYASSQEICNAKVRSTLVSGKRRPTRLTMMSKAEVCKRVEETRHRSRFTRCSRRDDIGDKVLTIKQNRRRLPK